MVRKKTNIVVLMGGKSPEYNVSVASGIEIVKKLSKRKYDISPILISPNGKHWYLSSPHSILNLPNPLDPQVLPDDLIPPVRKTLNGLSQLNVHIDVVFIAMHGPCGEDGTVQGMLDLAEVKYTGSGVLASAIGMDKLVFRQIMASYKILVPKYVVIKKNETLSKITKILGKPPYFVKPNNQGSSVGNSIVKTRKDLKKALNLAWKFSNIALVDEYLKGREFTIGVIGDKKPKAFPVVEIVTNQEFFDYKAKYQDEGTQEIVPATVDKKIAKMIQDVAISIFTKLSCRGVARVDFILKGKKLYVLEINTIPGMTENSLIPKSARAAGMSSSQLLDTIIKDAMR